jgi:chromosome segregation ATPase
MPSALDIDALVGRKKSALPRELPRLPLDVADQDVPRIPIPPEELARITQAKSDRAVLDRVSANARSGAWDVAVLEPLVQLGNNLAKENRELKAKVTVLEIELECKLNLSTDTRHELITIYEVHPDQAGRPTKDQFEELRVELETAKSDLQKRSNELEEKQEELDRRLSEEAVRELDVQRADAIFERDQHRETLRQLPTVEEFSEIQKKIKTLEEDAELRDLRLKDVQSNLDKTKSELENRPSEETVTNLREELEAVKAALKTRGEELDKTKVELAARTTEEAVSDLRGKVETTAQALQAREVELATARSDNKTHLEDIKNFNTQCDTLRANLETARAEVKGRDAQITTLESNHNDTAKTLKDTDEKLHKCEGELGDITAQLAARHTPEAVESLQAELDAAKADITARDGELDKTKAELAARTTEEAVNDLRGKMAEMKDRAEALQKQLSERLSPQDVANKDKELRDLQQKLDDALERPTTALHKSVEDRLVAATQRREKLDTDLAAKTQACEALQLDLNKLRLTLDDRPTHDALTSAQQTSEHWKALYEGIVNKSPPPAVGHSTLEEAKLQSEAISLRQKVTQQQASLDTAQADRVRLEESIATMNIERQQEATRLRADVTTADALAKTTATELVEYKEQATANARKLEEGAEVLRGDKEKLKDQLQDAEKNITQLQTLSRNTKEKLQAAENEATTHKFDLDDARRRKDTLETLLKKANNAADLAADEYATTAERAQQETQKLQTTSRELRDELRAAHEATATVESKLEDAKRDVGLRENDLEQEKSKTEFERSMRDKETKRAGDLAKKVIEEQYKCERIEESRAEFERKFKKAEDTAKTSNTRANDLDMDLHRVNHRVDALTRDKSRLEQDKKSAEDSLKNKDVIIEASEKKLNSAREDVDKAKVRHSELENEIRTANTNLATVTSDLDIARTNLGTAQTELEAAKQHTQSLEEEVRKTKEQCDAEVTVLQKKVETLSHDLGEKVKMVKDTADQLDAISALRLSAEETIESLEASAEVANSESRDVKTQLETEVQRAAVLQQDVDRLSRELEAARTNLTTLGTESGETETRHASTTATLQQNVDRLSSELHEKAQAVTQANTRIQSLTLDVESLTLKVESANTTARRLEARRYGLQCELNDTSEQSEATIAWQMAGTRALESERDTLRIERDQLQLAWYHSDSMVETLQVSEQEQRNEVNNLQQLLSDVQEEKRLSDAKVASLDGELGQEVEKSYRLENERDIQATELAQALEGKRASDTTAASLQANLNTLEEKLKELQADHDALEASQQGVADEATGADTTIENLTEDVDNLEQARAHLLQFMYTALARPGTTIEEFVGERAIIVERTKYHLKVLEYAWEKTERMRIAVSNQLVEEQADVGRLLAAAEQRGEARQEYMVIAATLREQLTAADDLLTGRDNHIATLTADVAARNARIEALSSAQQTALEEHLRVAVDLEKLKISHSALKRFVEEIIRDEDPDAS